jgi:hypothetical protein
MLSPGEMPSKRAEAAELDHALCRFGNEARHCVLIVAVSRHKAHFHDFDCPFIAQFGSAPHHLTALGDITLDADSKHIQTSDEEGRSRTVFLDGAIQPFHTRRLVHLDTFASQQALADLHHRFGVSKLRSATKPLVRGQIVLLNAVARLIQVAEHEHRQDKAIFALEGALEPAPRHRRITRNAHAIVVNYADFTHSVGTTAIGGAAKHAQAHRRVLRHPMAIDQRTADPERATIRTSIVCASKVFKRNVHVPLDAEPAGVHVAEEKERIAKVGFRGASIPAECRGRALFHTVTTHIQRSDRRHRHGTAEVRGATQPVARQFRTLFNTDAVLVALGDLEHCHNVAQLGRTPQVSRSGFDVLGNAIALFAVSCPMHIMQLHCHFTLVDEVCQLQKSRWSTHSSMR